MSNACDIVYAYIVAISHPAKLTGVACVKSQWQCVEQDLCQPNGREIRDKEGSVEREELHC